MRKTNQFSLVRRRSGTDRRLCARRSPCRGIQPGSVISLWSGVRRSPWIRLPTPMRLGPLRFCLDSAVMFSAASAGAGRGSRRRTRARRLRAGRARSASRGSGACASRAGDGLPGDNARGIRALDTRNAGSLNGGRCLSPVGVIEIAGAVVPVVAAVGIQAFAIVEIARSSGVSASLMCTAGERQEKQQRERNFLHDDCVAQGYSE